jgi:peptidoglycan/xylan/chitin deacetylase (PgdA/CDA1 family)
MYHNVVRGADDYGDVSPSATCYFVTESEFNRQLGAVTKSGGSFMNWTALQSFFAGSTEASGAYPVLLTFDDGWRDGVEIGGPVLKRHDVQALLFVTTDFLGRPHFPSRGELSRLDGDTFRVGSHARTHRMLSLLDEPEIRAELADSKKLLEDLVGYEIDSLSIPSGAVDHRVRRIAAECGYRFVFDSEVRVNGRGDSRLAIGRVAVMRNTTLPAFCRYVRQRIARERLRRAVLSAPKRLLGLRGYERLRRRLLGESAAQRVTHES